MGCSPGVAQSWTGLSTQCAGAHKTQDVGKVSRAELFHFVERHKEF